LVEFAEFAQTMVKPSMADYSKAEIKDAFVTIHRSLSKSPNDPDVDSEAVVKGLRFHGSHRMPENVARETVAVLKNPDDDTIDVDKLLDLIAD
jgi:hypothetical protein